MAKDQSMVALRDIIEFNLQMLEKVHGELSQHLFNLRVSFQEMSDHSPNKVIVLEEINQLEERIISLHTRWQRLQQELIHLSASSRVASIGLHVPETYMFDQVNRITVENYRRHSTCDAPRQKESPSF